MGNERLVLVLVIVLGAGKVVFIIQDLSLGK